MKYIEHVQINISNTKKIDKKFELGDLTILIGRANAGKTRILKQIFDLMNGYHNPNQVEYKKNLLQKGVKIAENVSKNLYPEFIGTQRENFDTFHGMSKTFSNTTKALCSIDPTIMDLGTKGISFSDGFERELKAQGSGCTNLMRILQQLGTSKDIFLIDEPEISQYPYGKIEVLKQIVDALETSQIIVATHDPTMINQYLIKKLIGKRDYTVNIYSFAEESFTKVNFQNRECPETHIGYLSKTYSGYPVHLVLEGPTDVSAFQALLTRFALYRDIPYFPKFLNRINISYMEGGDRWKSYMQCLPDSRFYNTFVLLDGDKKEDLEKLHKNKKLQKFFAKEDYNLVTNFANIKDNTINISVLSKQNIEEVFKPVFGKKCDKNNYELSKNIWKLPNKDLKKIIEPRKGDFYKIFRICNWCFEKAGWNPIGKVKTERLNREEQWEKHFNRWKKCLERKQPMPETSSVWAKRQRKRLREGTLPEKQKEKIENSYLEIKKAPFNWNLDNTKRGGRTKGSKDYKPRKKDGYITKNLILNKK